MDNDILDSLEDLGYQGAIGEEGVLEKALEGGPSSTEYTRLIEWLTKELSAFTGLEDHVNAVNGPDDEETFLMELSGFLREFGCPYPQLAEGPISQRLASRQSRLHLLDYLLTELQALRMMAVNKPHLVQKTMEVETSAESETARYMKQMLIALSFPKPPDGITAFQLFSKVEGKIKEILSKIQPAHLSKPLLKARLSDKQWENVNYVNTALRQEYECRRDMLLKRLDVTIQSFKWSERVKKQDDKLAALYQPIRRNLSSKVETDIAHLLAAREDLLQIEKTSSGKAREKTKTPLNRVKIGNVPDRGGRAYEHEIPPPEMPSFMQRQPQQQRQQNWSGRGGRGNRGGGGGFWKQNKRGRYN